MDRDTLVIFGCGGHAHSAADLALECGFSALIFVDEKAIANETILGFPVVKNETNLPKHSRIFFAIGDGYRRERLREELPIQKWTVETLISPGAHVAKSVTIGEGSFVGHGAYVGPGARVGQHCIINTGAVVEHESTVGDFSHISINAAVAGRSEIGKHCFLGANSTVLDGKSICNNTTVGAGAVVITNLSRSGTYVGVPATEVVAKPLI
ncbi:acetyltransferase [Luminiphilus sp.]|nr:acetyltransferase [Luminiphilus sp.]